MRSLTSAGVVFIAVLAFLSMSYTVLFHSRTHCRSDIIALAGCQNVPGEVLILSIPTMARTKRKLHDLFRHLLLTSPLITPLQHLFVPSNPIVSIKNPMVLTSKVHKPRRNIKSLQRIEDSDSLSVNETIISSSVDDQLGSFPILDVGARIPTVVIIGNVPGKSSEFSFGKVSVFVSMRQDSVSISNAGTYSSSVVYHVPEVENTPS